MKFYGTHESLVEWKELITKEFDVDASDVVTVNRREQFSVELTDEQREVIQNKFWYENNHTLGLKWNDRIAFSN